MIGNRREDSLSLNDSKGRGDDDETLLMREKDKLEGGDE